MACHDAVVARAGPLGTCGLSLDLVWSDHGDSYQARYCHGRVVQVLPDDFVYRGDPLGLVGYSGWTIPSGPDGAHLHFRVTINGVVVKSEGLLGL